MLKYKLEHKGVKEMAVSSISSGSQCSQANLHVHLLSFLVDYGQVEGW